MSRVPWRGLPLAELPVPAGLPDVAKRTDAHSTPSFISFTRHTELNMRLNNALEHKSFTTPSSDLPTPERKHDIVHV